MPSSPSQLRSLIMNSTFVLHPKNRHRIFGISNAFSNVRCACSCSHSSLELRATHTLSLSAHHSNGRSTLLAYDAFSPLFLPTCFNESNTFGSFQCTTATIVLHFTHTYGYFQRKKTQHITTTTKKFHVVCICLFLSSVTNIVVRCLALVSAVNEFILILVVRVSRTRHCFFYSSEMI